VVGGGLPWWLVDPHPTRAGAASTTIALATLAATRRAVLPAEVAERISTAETLLARDPSRLSPR
jgi:hypothetical protein